MLSSMTQTMPPKAETMPPKEETMPPKEETMPPKEENPEKHWSHFMTSLRGMMRILQGVLAFIVLVLVAVIMNENPNQGHMTEVTTPKGPATTSLITREMALGPNSTLDVWTDSEGIIRYIENGQEAQWFAGSAMEVSAGGVFDLSYKKHDAQVNVLFAPDGKIKWRVGDKDWLPTGTAVLYLHVNSSRLTVWTDSYGIINYKYGYSPVMWFYGTQVKLLADGKVELSYRKNDKKLEAWLEDDGKPKWSENGNENSTLLLDITSATFVAHWLTHPERIQYQISDYKPVTFNGKRIQIFSQDVEFLFTKKEARLEVHDYGRTEKALAWSEGYKGEVKIRRLVDYGVNVAMFTAKTGDIIFTVQNGVEQHFKGTEVIFLVGRVEIKYHKGDAYVKVKVSPGDEILWSGGNSKMFTLQLNSRTNSTLFLWTGDNGEIYYKEGNEQGKVFLGAKVAVASSGNVQLVYKRGDKKANILVTPDASVTWMVNVDEKTDVNATVRVTLDKKEMLSLLTDPNGVIFYTRNRKLLQWFEGSIVSVVAAAKVNLLYKRGDPEMTISVGENNNVQWKGGSGKNITIQLYIFTDSTIALHTGDDGLIYYRKDNNNDERFNGTDAIVQANGNGEIQIHYKKSDPELVVSVDAGGNVSWSGLISNDTNLQLEIPKGASMTLWTNSNGSICYEEYSGPFQAFQVESATLLADSTVKVKYVKGDPAMTVSVSEDGTVHWEGVAPSSLPSYHALVSANPRVKGIEIFCLILLVVTILEAIVIIVVFSKYNAPSGKLTVLILIIIDAVLLICYIAVTSLYETSRESSGGIYVMVTILLVALCILMLLNICGDCFMPTDSEETNREGDVEQPNPNAEPTKDAKGKEKVEQRDGNDKAEQKNDKDEQNKDKTEQKKR